MRFCAVTVHNRAREPDPLDEKKLGRAVVRTGFERQVGPINPRVYSEHDRGQTGES